MRTIKFRGKRIDTGKWVYGYFIYDEGWVNPYAIIVVDKYSHTSYRIIPETLGQFIGLQDKNGKDVYEEGIYLECLNHIFAEHKKLLKELEGKINNLLEKRLGRHSFKSIKRQKREAEKSKNHHE